MRRSVWDRVRNVKYGDTNEMENANEKISKKEVILSAELTDKGALFLTVPSDVNIRRIIVSSEGTRFASLFYPD